MLLANVLMLGEKVNPVPGSWYLFSRHVGAIYSFVLCSVVESAVF
jgi:hypothetical protein